MPTTEGYYYVYKKRKVKEILAKTKKAAEKGIVTGQVKEKPIGAFAWIIKEKDLPKVLQLRSTFNNIDVVKLPDENSIFLDNIGLDISSINRKEGYVCSTGFLVEDKVKKDKVKDEADNEIDTTPCATPDRFLIKLVSIVEIDSTYTTPVTELPISEMPIGVSFKCKEENSFAYKLLDLILNSAATFPAIQLEVFGVYDRGESSHTVSSESQAILLEKYHDMHHKVLKNPDIYFNVNYLRNDKYLRDNLGCRLVVVKLLEDIEEIELALSIEASKI